MSCLFPRFLIIIMHFLCLKHMTLDCRSVGHKMLSPASIFFRVDFIFVILWFVLMRLRHKQVFKYCIKYRRRLYVFAREGVVKGLEISVYRVCDLLIDVHHLRFRCSQLIQHSWQPWQQVSRQVEFIFRPSVQTTGRSRFVRCWHAKTNGWGASTFHSNRDGKGPTVTIVQVGSYIFGGYTDKSWSNPSKY